MSWEIGNLSIIANDVNETYHPDGSENLPYIGLEHVEPSTLHLSNIGSSLDVKSSKLKFREGDILFGTMRPYFRKVVRAAFDGVCSTEFSIIRATNPDDINYIFYHVANPKFIEFATINSKGDRPRTKWNLFSKFPAKIPPPQLRRRIGEILSSYDDLIENNLRRIKLLEESAKMLYKEWFVRLRFPGYEHTRIIDGVPEGWERKKLGELSRITMGQSPKSQFYNEYCEGLPFHQGVTDFSNRFVTHRMYCSVEKRIAEPGDILCSVRAPVGRLNITLDKIVIGRGLAAILSKTNHQSFLYYQLKNHFFKDDIVGTGAIFASITKDQLENQMMLTPTDFLIRQFEELTLPIDKQIENLSRQNQKLRQARDLLLPKLMSGDIDVDG